MVSHWLHMSYALLSDLLPIASAQMCGSYAPVLMVVCVCVCEQAEAGVRVGSDGDHD